MAGVQLPFEAGGLVSQGMSNSIHSLLIFGCGYVGEKLAQACLVEGIEVTATTRSDSRAEELRGLGMDAAVVESPEQLPDEILRQCDAVLDSIPLERNGEVPQEKWLPALLPKLSHIRWAGYLSTTGVYGDADGAWVERSKKGSGLVSCIHHLLR